jgi:hypothetical protein
MQFLDVFRLNSQVTTENLTKHILNENGVPAKFHKKFSLTLEGAKLVYTTNLQAMILEEYGGQLANIVTLELKVYNKFYAFVIQDNSTIACHGL